MSISTEHLRDFLAGRLDAGESQRVDELLADPNSDASRQFFALTRQIRARLSMVDWQVLAGLAMSCDAAEEEEGLALDSQLKQSALPTISEVVFRLTQARDVISLVGNRDTCRELVDTALAQVGTPPPTNRGSLFVYTQRLLAAAAALHRCLGKQTLLAAETGTTTFAAGETTPMRASPFDGRKRALDEAERHEDDLSADCFMLYIYAGRDVAQVAELLDITAEEVSRRIGVLRALEQMHDKTTGGVP